RRASAGSARVDRMASVPDVRKSGDRRNGAPLRRPGRRTRGRPLHGPGHCACLRRVGGDRWPPRLARLRPAGPRSAPLVRAAAEKHRRARLPAGLFPRSRSVIALATLLAVTPFAGAFWQRDLGTLARELAENRGAAQAELFRDLLRLCNCDALPPLESSDPLRRLVRVEAARRARVVASGAARDTIWRDLLRKDFFRRDAHNPPLANALIWPDEDEMWTGEVRYVEPPQWHCDKPAYAPGSQGDSTLVDELRSAGYAEAASRFAYHRATRLLALRERGYAEEQARAVDPAALPDLRHWAALLRIHLGIDGPEAAVALARDWHGPESLAARVLAADHLARGGRWAEIPEIAQDGTGPDAALFEHLRLLHARALLELGRRDEAVAVIPRDSRSGTARELAFEALAGRSIDASGAELVRALWHDPADAFARLPRCGSTPRRRSTTLLTVTAAAWRANWAQRPPCSAPARQGPRVWCRFLLHCRCRICRRCGSSGRSRARSSQFRTRTAARAT